MHVPCVKHISNLVPGCLQKHAEGRSEPGNIHSKIVNFFHLKLVVATIYS